MHADLTEEFVARGAVLAPFEGILLPAHYGDAAREWRAAREGAALFAGGLRRVIAARGDDRVAFLQGMLSNDVQALAPGAGCYAALLNQTGKVVSDLRVHAAGDRLLLDVLAWRAATLREALERYLIADDVELADAELQPLVQLEGPLATAVAQEVLGSPALPAAPLGHLRSSFGGAPLLVVRASELGADGILFCGPPEVQWGLVDTCRDAGAIPAGMGALDVLRVEAGVPWPGIDMDETTLLQEAGRDTALSFTKGCYLGQEVVERIAARGHVNRHLVGLLLDGAAPPARRTPLLAGDREVGYVTSAVHSPLLERPIALAFIHRKHAAPGERVQLGGGGSATVTALPFAGAGAAGEGEQA